MSEGIKTVLNLPPEHFTVRDVTEARGVVRVLRDNWWWCLGGDPRRAIFYVGARRSVRRFGSPQCNSNRAVSERIVPPLAGAVLCQVPVAFVPEEAH